MPTIVWSKRYSVNVENLDDQHKHMADLVNLMNERITAREDRDEILEGLTDLVKYTKGHFSAEEALMKKLDYPDYKKHKKEHNDLVNLLLDIKKQFRSKSKSLSDLTYDLAKNGLIIHSDWFAVHLVHSDKDLGSFLNKKGVE